jgi:(1->4)-alpha-D-glucan 1-alpha-D-glucosylmutase
MSERRPVGSTYRLQLTPEFGFTAVQELVGYLAQLGITHLYLSPILTARAGSDHGYDVADPSTVSEALGGEAGLRRLAVTAHDAGLGLVVDIVPNHMGIGPDNADWMSLLADGAGGEGGRVFDVDWHPSLPGAEGKVILPVLGDQYGTVLNNGELQLVEEPDAAGRRYSIRYHDHRFPLSPESQEALERVGRIEALTGTPGHPESWHRLHGLLEQQHYRLVHWRVGDRLINYRRFFAVDDLAGVRVEDEHVFDRTHGKILELVDAGVIDGLRVDHPDGLRHPAQYLERLERRTAGVWTVVEKITHPGELLEPWATAGTTGYEFCNDVLGLFVDPRAEEQFSAIDRAHGGDPRSYAEQVAAAKRDALANDLAAESQRLGQRLWALAQLHLDIRDLDDRHCTAAVVEALVGMAVYRSYVDPESGKATDRDRQTVAHAIAFARDTAEADEAVLDFLGAVLLGEAGRTPAHLDFLARFQQLSGAVMAKGVEDTVFYRFLRMVALNEVGGDPSRFGLSSEEFHRLNAQRARRHPRAMVTTATHDTKRGEDVRLRIAALTELPGGWSELADALIAAADLDGPTTSLVLQTMVGIWPLLDSGVPTPEFRQRLRDYVVKAARESGLHTGWYDPDDGYEQRATRLVDTLLDSEQACKRLTAVATAAAEIGMVSALAQVVLRTLSPGVPDIYQGNELWDDSLVDPDNRRPVDFARRRAMLDELAVADPVDLWEHRRDGRVKLWALTRCLHVRHEEAEAFGGVGGYRALPAGGRWADHVVAFARTAGGGARVIVVTPRLPGAVMGPEQQPPLGDQWADTSVPLPPGAWRNVMGGDRVWSGDMAVGDLLTDVPVAVLVTAD